MKYLWIILIPILLYALYVVAVLGFGTLNDYKPQEVTALNTENNKTESVQDSARLSFMIWNIGYSGLGDKSDFFLDGGKMVRPSKAIHQEYFNGIKKTIAEHSNADFILLQEVDVNSKRSYETNEYQEIANELADNYSNAIALNFNVKYVPKPLTSFSPIGKVKSGVATYSKYNVTQTTRFQYPGSYDWPVRVFHLDRCMLESRIPVANGKELIVINSHNSAYDGGKLKPLEMEYLRNHLMAEYQKGNYVIVGADWNQCPPNFNYATFAQGSADDYYQDNIAEDFMPEGWLWAYDTTTPTNRKLAAPYKKGETFTTLIDFYLVSPNVKIEAVKGVNIDFKYSDHQPVLLNVQLQ